MKTPRWYQSECVEAILHYCQNYSGNPVAALPTATGKSFIITLLLKQILEGAPDQRFMVLCDDERLVGQNYNDMLEEWPTAPAGMYCAGLDRRDIHLPIIYGTIQSVRKKAVEFGHRDAILIDEAHMLSPNENTMFQKFIADMRLINPNILIIGFTATPFRVGQGMITDGGLFTDICYDLTEFTKFNRLIDEKYLCPLISPSLETRIDLAGVDVQNGDFNLKQLQKVTDKKEITISALNETMRHCGDRKKWILFASGIEHAEHCADYLKELGVKAKVIHSKMKKEDVKAAIDEFKNGGLTCLVNNDMITTGFDCKAVDLIIMLRATMSPGLYIQMLGRGMRIMWEVKQNCLVLDFARNIERLGPVNDPVIPKRKGATKGDIPVRICPSCGYYNHLSARVCGICGFEFPVMPKIVTEASNLALIKTDPIIVESFAVKKVEYKLHKKLGKADSLRVIYWISAIRTFNEYICPESGAYAKKKAFDWFRQRTEAEPPESASEMLKYSSELRIPKQIRVWVKKKWPEVMSYEF